MVNKVMTAKQLEDLGIPYCVDAVVDWWETTTYYSAEYSATVMLVFKMDDKFYGVEVFDVWEGQYGELHWWSCHKSEDKIIVTEMQAQEIVSTRYVPVPDNTVDQAAASESD